MRGGVNDGKVDTVATGRLQSRFQPRSRDGHDGGAISPPLVTPAGGGGLRVEVQDGSPPASDLRGDRKVDGESCLTCAVRRLDSRYEPGSHRIAGWTVSDTGSGATSWAGCC